MSILVIDFIVDDRFPLLILHQSLHRLLFISVREVNNSRHAVSLVEMILLEAKSYTSRDVPPVIY